MHLTALDDVRNELAGFDPGQADYAARVVDASLEAARAIDASDVHFQPGGAGLEMKFRIDGVLLPAALFPTRLAGNIIARLKVLAGLLTYQTDRPQEGRMRALATAEVEMRVSTFPTLHGERAVVRLFGGSARYRRLDDLGLPADLLQILRGLLAETSGAILVSGPAGSGKTTTVYACLREIIAQSEGSRSLVSLEDPIEVAVEGVAQSQVHPPSGLDLATGLRFLLRHDPEVIAVGEIRDRPTAEAALQASLTGHLVLSTFHAGSAAETVGRLLDMGIEPYILQSGLLAILNQRLLRRLCSCANGGKGDSPHLCEAPEGPSRQMGTVPFSACSCKGGCKECNGTGYRGRFLLTEMLVPSRSGLGPAILARSDAASIERLACEAGMVGRWQRAYQAVDDGLTTMDEVRRLLGSEPLEPGDSRQNDGNRDT